MCSVTGATCTPAVTSRVTSDAVKGRPAEAISALPGRRAEDRLVGGERVAPVEVAVGDRAAVPADLSVQVAADRRAPEPVAGPGRGRGRVRGHGDQQHQAYVSDAHHITRPRHRGGREPRRARCAAPRPGRRRRGGAPRAARPASRPATASTSALTVAEVFTTRRSPARRCSGRSRNWPWDRPSGVAHQQAYLVALQPALLGRLRREGRGGEVGCAGSRRAASSGSPPPGSARTRAAASSSASRRGTTVSGSGRSEMSSPGKASWCMAVRMSPGSTAYPVEPALRGERQRHVVERGLAGAVEAPGLVVVDRGVGADPEQDAVRHLQPRAAASR